MYVCMYAGLEIKLLYLVAHRASRCQKLLGPQKSYWPEIYFYLKKPLFCNTSHYKSKYVSLAVIYFAFGDLLPCFQSVFRMADNVAAGIVCRSRSSSCFENDG